MNQGAEAERKVRRELEAEGWVVFDVRGRSLRTQRGHVQGGTTVCDFVALRVVGQRHDTASGETRPLAEAVMVEVKATTRSPWLKFGPEQRAALAEAAKRAGAVPLLAWCPPGRECQWIGEAEWPSR